MSSRLINQCSYGDSGSEDFVPFPIIFYCFICFLYLYYAEFGQKVGFMKNVLLETKIERVSNLSFLGSELFVLFYGVYLTHFKPMCLFDTNRNH